jgi:trigger factor
VLAEVGRVNNLQVSQEEMNRAMVAEARRYPGQERKVLDYFKEHPEAAEALAGPILEEKVVDFILEMGTVTERRVSTDELLKSEDEQASPGQPEITDESEQQPEAKPETGEDGKAGASG